MKRGEGGSNAWSSRTPAGQNRIPAPGAATPSGRAAAGAPSDRAKVPAARTYRSAESYHEPFRREAGTGSSKRSTADADPKRAPGDRRPVAGGTGRDPRSGAEGKSTGSPAGATVKPGTGTPVHETSSLAAGGSKGHASGSSHDHWSSHHSNRHHRRHRDRDFYFWFGWGGYSACWSLGYSPWWGGYLSCAFGWWYPWYHGWYYPYYHYRYWSWCPTYYPYSFHSAPYYRYLVVYEPVYVGYQNDPYVGDPYVEEIPETRSTESESAAAPPAPAPGPSSKPAPAPTHPMDLPLAAAPEGVAGHDALIEAGDALLGSERWREAAEAYRRAALERPGALAHVRLAFALLAVGEVTFAGWALEQGLVPDDGGLLDASLALSRTFAKSGPGAAISRAERHLVENPNDEHGSLILATVYLLTERPFGATLLLGQLRGSSIRDDVVSGLSARAESRITKR